MTFLEKLDYLMGKKGLNKSTLSKACNIPYTTIDGWYKKGYEGLKLTTLRKLADFFDTSLDFWASDELFEDIETEKIAFYKVLQKIIDERNLSIPEVARASGLSDSTVRSIIARKSKGVALEVAFKLSRGLGVSLEELNGDMVADSLVVSVFETTPAEQTYIKKYRQLDQRGQRAVDETLEREYQEVVKSLPKSDKTKTDGAVHWEMAARNGHGASGTMTAEEAEEFFKLCDETERSDDL